MVAGKLAAQCMTYMKKGEMINNTKKSRRPFEKGRALPYMNKTHGNFEKNVPHWVWS